MFNSMQRYLAVVCELSPGVYRSLQRSISRSRASADKILLESPIWYDQILLKRVLQRLSKAAAQCYPGGLGDPEFDCLLAAIKIAAFDILSDRVIAAKEAGLDTLLYIGDMLVVQAMGHCSPVECEQLHSTLLALA